MNALRRWTAADWATAAVAGYIIGHVVAAFASGRFPI